MQLPRNVADGWAHDAYAQDFQGACEAHVTANDRLAQPQKDSLTAEAAALEAPRLVVVAAQQELDVHVRTLAPRLLGRARVYDFLCDDAFSETNEFLNRREPEVRAAQTTVDAILGTLVGVLRHLGRGRTAKAALAIAERLARLAELVPGAGPLASRLRQRGEAFAGVVEELEAQELREQKLADAVTTANVALRKLLIAAYGRLLGDFPKPVVESLFSRPATARRRRPQPQPETPPGA